MKNDVQIWLSIRGPEKGPSKETRNYPKLIVLAPGCDPCRQIAEAYRRVCASLGIDLINIVPQENAPASMKRGKTRIHDDGVMRSYFRLHGTTARVRFRFETEESVLGARSKRGRILRPQTPERAIHGGMPPRCDRAEIPAIGDVDVYYYQLYATPFMLAAISDPRRFGRYV